MKRRISLSVFLLLGLVLTMGISSKAAESVPLVKGDNILHIWADNGGGFETVEIGQSEQGKKYGYNYLKLLDINGEVLYGGSIPINLTGLCFEDTKVYEDGTSREGVKKIEVSFKDGVAGEMKVFIPDSAVSVDLSSVGCPDLTLNLSQDSDFKNLKNFRICNLNIKLDNCKIDTRVVNPSGNDVSLLCSRFYDVSFKFNGHHLYNSSENTFVNSDIKFLNCTLEENNLFYSSILKNSNIELKFWSDGELTGDTLSFLKKSKIDGENTLAITNISKSLLLEGSECFIEEVGTEDSGDGDILYNYRVSDKATTTEQTTEKATTEVDLYEGGTTENNTEKATDEEVSTEKTTEVDLYEGGTTENSTEKATTEVDLHEEGTTENSTEKATGEEVSTEKVTTEVDLYEGGTTENSTEKATDEEDSTESPIQEGNMIDYDDLYFELGLGDGKFENKFMSCAVMVYESAEDVEGLEFDELPEPVQEGYTFIAWRVNGVEIKGIPYYEDGSILCSGDESVVIPLQSDKVVFEAVYKEKGIIEDQDSTEVATTDNNTSEEDITEEQSNIEEGKTEENVTEEKDIHSSEDVTEEGKTEENVTEEKDIHSLEGKTEEITSEESTIEGVFVPTTRIEILVPKTNEPTEKVTTPSTEKATADIQRPTEAYVSQQTDNKATFQVTTEASTQKPAEVLINLKKVSLKSVKSTKKKTIVIKWGNISGAKYEIQLSTSKKFKGIKSYTSKGTSKKIKKLKSGKTYYVRVRASKVSSEGTYYGNWSKVKKVKVK